MRYLAIDTETTLIPPTGTDKVNTRWTHPDLIVTTWSLDEEEEGLCMWHDVAEHERLIRLVEDNEDIILVMHNVAFDLGVLSKEFPQFEERLQQLVRDGKVLDTKVMYLLRHPDPGPGEKAASLAMLSQKLLHLPMEKGAVRTSFRRDMPISDAQREYAVKDAVITRKIAEQLRALPLGCFRNHWGAPPPNRMIATSPDTDFRHPDVEYSSAACWMAWKLKPVGMAVDKERLREIHVKFEDQFGRLQAQLVGEGLARVVRMPGAEVRHIGKAPEGCELERRWMPTSVTPPTMQRKWKGNIEQVAGKVTKNMSDLEESFQKFAEDLGIDCPTSKNGKVSLRRDDWKDYTNAMPAGLKIFMEFQKCQKYLTAFLRPLTDARATQVLADYWVPGAATGRWACTKPNLQQVPRAGGIRSIYKAREGKRLIYADYPTLELYTLAHSMHCMGIRGPLMESLYSGDDIHTRTAALMYGKELGDVTKEERQGAKAANFGLPGGMGVNRFHIQAKVMGLGWDRNQAYDIRNRWFAAYPDIREFLNAFELNPYKQLKPPGMDTREWLERLGFDPDDTWPRSFDVTRKINNGGVYTVVLPSGRTIPDRQYSAAANCFFQGPGADTITRAFSNVCENERLNPVAVVHDSITIEQPEIDAYADAQLLAACMADALVTVCPSVPRPKIDTEILEVWK